MIEAKEHSKCSLVETETGLSTGKDLDIAYKPSQPQIAIQDCKKLKLQEKTPKSIDPVEKMIENPIEHIDSQVKPQEIILIDDDDGDDTTVTSESQISKCSPSQDTCIIFNTNGKRPSQTTFITPLIKKAIAPNEELELKIHEKLAEEPQETLLTKPINKSTTLHCLKPFWGPCTGLTKAVALDCEMVQVEGKVQALARCSIVNYDGHVLFDQMIKPEKRVTNYLSWVSGIRASHLADSLPYEHYREEIFNILKDSIIVGHSLKGDCEVLGFKPNPDNMRDLAQYNALKVNNMTQSLKSLATKYLNVNIQRGSHDSVEDARTSMALYRKLEVQWEKDIKTAVLKKRYSS